MAQDKKTCMIKVDVPRSLKLLTFLVFEIQFRKVTLLQRQRVIVIRIYPLESIKIREKSLFIPENIVSGPKIHASYAFPGFQARQKIHVFKASIFNPIRAKGEARGEADSAFCVFLSITSPIKTPCLSNFVTLKFFLFTSSV